MSDNLQKRSKTNSRLLGLDLARGLAVIGMVLVNFVYVFSHDLVVTLEIDPNSMSMLSPLAQGIVGSILVGMAGRAAAVFLVLFGIGISLQIRRISFENTTHWARPFIPDMLC